jgi:hypothetical protein
LVGWVDGDGKGYGFSAGCSVLVPAGSNWDLLFLLLGFGVCFLGKLMRLKKMFFFFIFFLVFNIKILNIIKKY